MPTCCHQWVCTDGHSSDAYLQYLSVSSLWGLGWTWEVNLTFTWQQISTFHQFMTTNRFHVTVNLTVFTSLTAALSPSRQQGHLDEFNWLQVFAGLLSLWRNHVRGNETATSLHTVAVILVLLWSPTTVFPSLPSAETQPGGYQCSEQQVRKKAMHSPWYKAAAGWEPVTCDTTTTPTSCCRRSMSPILQYCQGMQMQVLSLCCTGGWDMQDSRVV